MIHIFFIVDLIFRVRRRVKNYIVYPRIFIAMTVVILVSGYLIYWFEKGKSPYFHSWWDGIWFAVITSSTVGYGDKVPVTVPGKLVTMGLILIGGSLLAVLLANIGGSLTMRMNRKERGLLAVRHVKGHVVICHWNKQAKAAIADFYKVHRNIKFVLIDGYIEENPVSDYDVHFIRGNFSEDETLIRANIEHARTVLIFGDKRIDEATADAKSMKAILAIKHLNPAAHVIVECVSGDVRSLQRVGADEVIDTGAINSRMLVESSLSTGVSSVLRELLMHEAGNQFYESIAPHRYVGQPFSEVAADMRQYGANLIAIRGKETTVNPEASTLIDANTVLIYIATNRIPS